MDKEGVGADWRRIDDSPCYLVRSYEAVGADPIVGCAWQEAGAPFGWSRWLPCGAPGCDGRFPVVPLWLLGPC
jgi:hypothetical protein